MEKEQESENVIGMPVRNVLLIIIAIGTDIVLVTLVFLQQRVVVQTSNAILAKNVKMDYVNIEEWNAKLQLLRTRTTGTGITIQIG